MCADARSEAQICEADREAEAANGSRSGKRFAFDAVADRSRNGASRALNRSRSVFNTRVIRGMIRALLAVHSWEL